MDRERAFPARRVPGRLAAPGSVAASVYGEPRLTADIDIVLLLKTADLGRLLAAFPEREYYVPPEDMLRIEISRGARGGFNLIHHATQFKADIYLAASDPLHAWALEHRRRIDLEGGKAWVAPPEYEVNRLGLQAQWRQCKAGVS
jgi:hypothetical protein